MVKTCGKDRVFLLLHILIDKEYAREDMQWFCAKFSILDDCVLQVILVKCAL